MSGKTFDAIYQIVSAIPRGKVATYGLVAALAGNPRLARAVGNAMHANPDHSRIPCHRVLHADGKLSVAFKFGGINRQHDILADEGVHFIDYEHVDLSRSLMDVESFDISLAMWKPET